MNQFPDPLVLTCTIRPTDRIHLTAEPDAVTVRYREATERLPAEEVRRLASWLGFALHQTTTDKEAWNFQSENQRLDVRIYHEEAGVEPVCIQLKESVYGPLSMAWDVLVWLGSYLEARHAA